MTAAVAGATFVPMNRRDELLSRATDYVLEHGLIGLSLRPLAAELGTSDRMLVYHFGTKDALVVALIHSVTERSNAAVRALAPARTVRAVVVQLWKAHTHGQLDSCQRCYAQAAATGMLGDQPYRDAVRAADDVWTGTLATYLLGCGAPARRVNRIVRLVDAGIMGLHLELQVTQDPTESTRAVADLADAAQHLADA